MTEDLDELRALAQACLDADGGLPRLTDDGLLRARLRAGTTLDIRDADDVLVATGSVAVRDGAAMTSGLVHPGHRGVGHGRNLLAWARDQAGSAPLTVTCENVNPAAERLYARFGLERFFAEQVMRHPLGSVPDVAAPEGVTLVPVADASRADLFAAYAGAFSDRPGFPDPTEEEWLEELDGDPEWRRDVSAVALGEHGEPVGFVNVLGTWVDQVGVVPAWRGRGLGAHLVVRALAGLDGEAWLSVNLDNPAGDLYASLGFERYGVRGRWA
ncbi:GNAT family N-acetyltransferase [Nocardioides sp. URHA0032]|uniref:GNAT family N-acetyltransferase n=1 Tax=Nocardioides sp. URHA0032 TaxID=1380388 RepID=UPI000685D53C|nr:GNAT family N-acetyltransferase [Nocardioides sp. URHA0032]